MFFLLIDTISIFDQLFQNVSVLIAPLVYLHSKKSLKLRNQTNQQYNGQQTKEQTMIYKTLHRKLRSSNKNTANSRGKPRYSGRVCSSCSTCDTVVLLLLQTQR